MKELQIKRTYAISEEKTYLIDDAIDYLLRRDDEDKFLLEVRADPESFLSKNSNGIIMTPYDPTEMWGSGISYYISKQRYTERDVARIKEKSIYEAVYDAERPEIFFKGTARCVVGHNGTIRVRRDSDWTLPEPELAVILGRNSRVLAYTIFDDVSARDIEAENPLYLPESKIYDGSSAFGPYLVTPDEFGDPYSKNVVMRVHRNGEILFEGATSTSNMKTKIDKQISYLLRDNSVPDGTLLTTGTAIVPSREQGLMNGDIVEISIDKLGTLVTRVEKF